MGLLTGCFLAMALLHVATAIEWKPCGGKADIKSVVLTPDPPSPGDTISFDIEAQSDISVSSGTVDVAVAYRGLPIYTEEKDLCDRTKCPVQPGPLSLKYDQYLPPIAPPGPYVVNITAFASDPAPQGTQLMCLTVDFDIAPPQPPPAVEHLMDSIKRGAVGIAESYKKQTA